MMPRRALYASVAVVLFLSFFLAPAAIYGTTADHLLITEVMYDPATTEPGGEWLEIYNPTATAVSLTGWKVRDNQSEDVLPELTLSPGQFLVVAASRDGFLAAFAGFAGNLASLDSPIGGGLANGGDRVLLLDSQGAQVDAVSYGSDATAFSPPCPGVPEGSSLGRWPNDADTDSAGDWAVQPQPNPGGPAAPAPVATPTSVPASTVTATATPVSPASPSPSPTATRTATPGSWPKLLITEVEYDSIQDGTDSDFEWLEVLNPNGSSVSLDGWRVADAASSDPLPAYTLPPGAYLVVASKAAGFRTNYPGFDGRLAALESPIGNGLSNTGDAVKLIAPDGAVIDALSYGNDKSVFDPSCPDVSAGQSLARAPGAPDTDSALDWLIQNSPNPGVAAPPATVTPTATEMRTPTPTRTRTATPTASSGGTGTPTLTPRPSTTPTKTASATATSTTNPVWHTAVLLTEVLYAPVAESNENQYEWLELYNRSDEAIPLDGWRIEDNTSSDAIPNYLLQSGAYLVVAAVRASFLAANPGYLGPLVAIEGSIGNGLSNTGDRVRLIAPDGFVADALSYGADKSVFDPPIATVPRGFSLARVPSTQDSDSAADWLAQETPSPGGPGAQATKTPSPTITATPTSSATSPYTGTPSLTPTATPTSSATPHYTGTPTATGTAQASPTPSPTGTATTYLPLVVRLNEILPAPSAIDWNKDGAVNSDDEWLELHNRTDQPVDLTGWQLDDIAGGGSKPFILPAGSVLQPHGFLVVFHGQSRISMNNDGDTVRLLTPEGKETDVFTYTSSRPDRSFSRTADDPAAWTADYPPSPGVENVAPTPTPSPTATATGTAIPEGVFLNEVLPDPHSVDWDADGQANWRDEWLELYNTRDQAAALGGWQVLHPTGAYTIPNGTVIWPQGYLLLFRRQTGLALSDWRDSVTLLRPDGRVADQFTYNAGPGADRSYCRIPDGSGGWTGGCESTPGRTNKLLPPPPPAPAGATATPKPPATPRTIARARTVGVDTHVTITGTVTLPPGLIPQTIYVQDATGGIRVYLRKDGYGPIKLWDQVRISGWTRDFYGEKEISVPDAGYIIVLGPGKPVAPKPVTSVGLIEENEGRLVQVIGAIARYETHALVLKDRGGLIRIYFPESLPWRRPYVQIGQVWAAQGVLSQHSGEESVDAGYEIIPRFETDVARGPAYLPVTGIELTR